MTLKSKDGRVRDKGSGERATWGDGIELVVKKWDSTEAPNLQLTGACCVLCPLYDFFFFGPTVLDVKIQVQETWNCSHY